MKTKEKILNTFLNGFTIKIVNDYLHFLENNKNDIPEIILDYLDQSIFLMRKKININKLKEKINIMEKSKSDIIDKKYHYVVMEEKENTDLELIREMAINN